MTTFHQSASLGRLTQRLARSLFLAGLLALPLAASQAAVGSSHATTNTTNTTATPPANWSQLPAGLRTVLSDLYDALNLTPAQQAQFLKAVAATQVVIPQIQANHQTLIKDAQAELAKAVPDLAALATEKDNTELANLALRQSARAEWLNLYAMLSPDQVAVVKKTLNELITRLESLRQLFPLANGSAL